MTQTRTVLLHLPDWALQFLPDGEQERRIFHVMSSTKRTDWLRMRRSVYCAQLFKEDWDG